MRREGVHVGVAGVGGIGLASAAWLRQAGFGVTLWSPRGTGLAGPARCALQATGVVQGGFEVQLAQSAAELARHADMLLIAVPVNGHKAVFDALAPHLKSGQTLLVSSMSSLSALYVYELAKGRGVDITVVSMGTTTLTARRAAPTEVKVMTRRTRLGISTLPQSALPQARQLCQALFGDVFDEDANALASALTNINPVAHAPLAVFNWTRIERAEHWPQYHYMTPHVASVIVRLDAERRALARAFGLQVRSIEEHFAKSFNTRSAQLADIAAELHASRGGPPGPTDVGTRFLGEDVPYGLVFSSVLARIAGMPMPCTETMIEAASLITGRNLRAENDLIDALGLRTETFDGLLARLR
ncbi:NAD/NADP octopine/nopaline dehydrogenase family protein [Alicycliphilus denitrificans]|uniref:NAD/NADP octopine/nopaline dehydrogenase family protein n=1 Tax=Alicycliphilus denitrificans TaxID=179636 RepID=UPI00384DCCC6